MRARALVCFVSAATLLSAAGCAHRYGCGRDDFSDALRTPQPLNNNPDNFQFAVVADRHGGMRPKVFDEAMVKLNLLQPEFVMCVGDLISGYSEDFPELDKQWAEVNASLAKLKMSFFYLPGNHDISNAKMLEYYNRRFGRSYYHFVYRDVLFLCLNTEDPPDTQFSKEQIAYAAGVLAKNADVRHTFIFMHKPMWQNDPKRGWTALEKLLVGRPCTIFAGHTHRYMADDRDGRRYFILATTGGASALRGGETGEFDHLVWVTMTDRGPVIANLMLAGIGDQSIPTRETVELYEGILGKFSATSAPIFLQGDKFEGTTTPLVLKNGSDYEMKIHGSFAPNDSLKIEPALFDLTLPAKSERKLEVKLAPTGSTNVNSIPPAVLNASSVADVPKLGKQVRQDVTSRIVLDRILFPCPRRAAAVQVDGKLDEWQGPGGALNLPIVCEQPGQIQMAADSWAGPADCSFRFAVEYDDNFLYVAVETIDDRFQPDPPREPWTRDGIELRLDARPDPQRSAGRGEGEKEQFAFVALCPADSPADTYCFMREKLPEGTKFACVKTPKGHNTEVAIPIKYLDAKQGKAWEAFRLNIQVDDFDGAPGDNAAAAQLCWRPDWRYEANYAGSGTFVKK